MGVRQNYHLLVLLVIVTIFIPIIVENIFAQNSLSLTTNKSTFELGELVSIEGTGSPNQPVAIEVKDPDGNTVLIRTVQPDSSGNFVLQFKIPSSGMIGKYNIVANAEINGQKVTQTKQITLGSPSGQQSSNQKNGCLIATAAFGSELAPQVQQLRETRDNVVMKTKTGSAFMTGFNLFYYSFAPTVAEWEMSNQYFKEIVKGTITPLVTTLSILNYIPIHSDGEMLFYGISVILLNAGMYFVAPIFGVVKLRNYLAKRNEN